jgi:hypothetical protein
MATVFMSSRGYRVAVNSNDHPPPHVHVYAPDKEARFRLNCPDGPVELWDYQGRWRLRELNGLGEEIAERLAESCAKWNDIHG